MVKVVCWLYVSGFSSRGALTAKQHTKGNRALDADRSPWIWDRGSLPIRETLKRAGPPALSTQETGVSEAAKPGRPTLREPIGRLEGPRSLFRIGNRRAAPQGGWTASLQV